MTIVCTIFQLVDQLLVMTTRFMHFLDHRTMMIKYMIPLSEVHRISVSPFQDCVVAVHLQKVTIIPLMY